LRLEVALDYPEVLFFGAFLKNVLVVALIRATWWIKTFHLTSAFRQLIPHCVHPATWRILRRRVFQTTVQLGRSYRRCVTDLVQKL